ncbi:MAG TPA: Fic family protein [Acidimicrobiales bacterium]|nr:Fic family protein [Acidimicrobiales bacterium]
MLDFDKVRELRSAALAAFLSVPPWTDDGKYRHWDTLRHLSPPAGLDVEQWWMGVKFARRGLLNPLPLTDPAGRPFQYCMPDAAWEMAHRIDQQTAGRIGTAEVVTNTHTRSRYIVTSLMEEAITSSQLEGAVTSRVVAKEMIRSGRPPRDHSERMIVNNYQGINLVRELAKEPLTPEAVLTIHRVMTEGTLADPSAAGRLQLPEEKRVSVMDDENNVLHAPPPAEQLPSRLEAMCAFANGEDGVRGFMHPVVRSILLHLWLAYDHPFVDGNGRTARALFYWSMLRRRYWLAEFLSISRILRKAPGQYGRAFLYVETDELDATYFVLYQLAVICRAIDDLDDYLRRKTAELREVEALIRRSDTYNHRQLALLQHALRTGDARYTFRSHAASHNVTHQSARSDLHDLARRGLLVRGKRGKEYVFSPVPDLAERLQTG